jgi:hypothetical protein
VVQSPLRPPASGQRRRPSSRPLGAPDQTSLSKDGHGVRLDPLIAVLHALDYHVTRRWRGFERRKRGSSAKRASARPRRRPPCRRPRSLPSLAGAVPGARPGRPQAGERRHRPVRWSKRVAPASPEPPLAGPGAEPVEQRAISLDHGGQGVEVALAGAIGLADTRSQRRVGDQGLQCAAEGGLG